MAGPGIPFVAFYGSITLVFPTYLTQHFGFSLGAAATVLSAVRLWETGIAPLVGALSDATASRFGRRIVWMAAAAPIVLAATTLLYFAPPDLPAGVLTAALLALGTGWTMINVPHGAWALEISNRTEDRARIFGMRQFVGYGAMILFLLGPAVTERWWPDRGVAGQMALVGGLILVSLPASLALLARLVPERPAAPSPLAARQVWRVYVLPLRKPAFAPVAALFAAMGIYTAVESALYLFLVRAGLGLEAWGMSLLLLQFTCGLASIPIWLGVRRRWGTVPTLRLVAALQGVSSLALAFLPHGQLAPFLGLAILRGMVNGTEFILIRTLLGGLLEDHTARHADVPAASYYASFHFLFDVAAALTTFVVLHALAGTGFDPRAAGVTGPDQAERIKWLATIALSMPPLLTLGLLCRMPPLPGGRMPASVSSALRSS
ncbi:Na+/melibiose symporter-like transporter [Nitrospirillum pindoramense]|uniref:Na+/melibiose symporter-like transporter n=1 Tax=Nitrospirillum amazonense TaxID=28077 RepID=A0A560H5P5_9PROT|nr:Na+/melibiose symporter-like transporter [Nitrospirillum amazonense]